VYFDKFRFLTDPALLRDLATAVAELIPGGITHLAAPEGAATLLVAAVALEVSLPIAVVRKEPKAYGTRSQVEAHGCRVGIILLAIDRSGGAAVREAGYRVRSVVEVTRPATSP